MVEQVKAKVIGEMRGALLWGGGSTILLHSSPTSPLLLLIENFDLQNCFELYNLKNKQTGGFYSKAD
jgi:hypothetical protein